MVTTFAGHIGLVFLTGQADNVFEAEMRLAPRVGWPRLSVSAGSGALFGEWARQGLNLQPTDSKSVALGQFELRAHKGDVQRLAPLNVPRLLAYRWASEHSCSPLAWIERIKSFVALNNLFQLALKLPRSNFLFRFGKKSCSHGILHNRTPLIERGATFRALRLQICGSHPFERGADGCQRVRLVMSKVESHLHEAIPNIGRCEPFALVFRKDQFNCVLKTSAFRIYVLHSAPIRVLFVFGKQREHRSKQLIDFHDLHSNFVTPLNQFHAACHEFAKHLEVVDRLL
jgi:hypothetical protein